MELAHWESMPTDSTPGSETSEATLYLKHYGSLVPVLKISSLGELQVRNNGAWQDVLTAAALPANVITTDG